MKKLTSIISLLLLSLGLSAQVSPGQKGPDYFSSLDETVGKVVRFFHQKNLLKSVGPYLFYKEGSSYKPYKSASTYVDILGSNITVVEIIPDDKGSYLRLRPATRGYDGPDYFLSTRRFDPSKHMRSVTYWRELLLGLNGRYPYADGTAEKYSDNKAPRLAGKYLKLQWKSYTAPDDFNDPVIYNYVAGDKKYSIEYRFLFRSNLPSSEFLSEEEFAKAESAWNGQ